jgi:hypothetical protein
VQYKKPENFTHFGAKSNLKRRILVIQYQNGEEMALVSAIIRLSYHTNAISRAVIFSSGEYK